MASRIAKSAKRVAGFAPKSRASVHAMLRRALGHLAVLLKPPQHLTVRNLILGLDQQVAGLNDMFASLPHGGCCCLVRDTGFDNRAGSLGIGLAPGEGCMTKPHLVCSKWASRSDDDPSVQRLGLASAAKISPKLWSAVQKS